MKVAIIGAMDKEIERFLELYNASIVDEKRKIYPRISIASKVTKNNTSEDILFSLAHEITHYYQWYFGEEDKRTGRSLEIEANKWSGYIVGLYSNEK